MDSFFGACLTGSVGEEDGSVGKDGDSVGAEDASVGPVVGSEGAVGAWVAPVVGVSVSGASVETVGSVGAVDSLGGNAWKQPLSIIASSKRIAVIRFILVFLSCEVCRNIRYFLDYTRQAAKLQEKTTHLPGKTGGKY